MTDVVRVCVFCNKTVEAWLPFGEGLAGLSPFLQRLETIGSNVERFRCPHCSSFDRERHLRLYIERRNLFEPIRAGAVLHLSPEGSLRPLIRSYNPTLYVLGDLNPMDAEVQKIDMQKIRFPDETFDLAIANHTLEHVEDLTLALREIHRVLKPGARFLCQTPYASRLGKTLEEPGLQTESDRIFFYGQNDHVRLFGLDIEELIPAAGFVGRLVPHAEILPDVDGEAAGVNELEPFFDFIRR